MRVLRVLFVCLAVAVTVGGLTARAEADVTLPAAGELADQPSSNGLPFSGGIHFYQQVFDATLFTGPLDLNEVRFRADGGPILALPVVLNMEVSLSTTSKAPDGLSSPASSNVGPDSTVVFSGLFTLEVPIETDLLFDVFIPFTTGFTYDPAAGNLLLQLAFPGGTPFLLLVVDSTGSSISPDGDEISRFFSFSASGAGESDTIGAITQFGTGPVAGAGGGGGAGGPVPEPGTIVLVALGIAGLIARRRAA